MSRPRLGLAVATAAALFLPALPSALATPPAAAVERGAAVPTIALDSSASSISAAAVDALCTDPATQAASARLAPGGRGPDTPPVTSRDLAALDVPTTGAQARSAARALDDTVTIPVHVVLVRGAHRGDVANKPAAVPGWIAILNDAYAGGQSTDAAPSRYRFVQASVRQVKNDRWYHAVANSAADKQMRRKLRKGGPGALNLYVTKPGRGGDVLGFARFPWQYAANPRLDGVTVNRQSLPGGAVRGYNAGDTLVHEVGHWMGLFHTFQGGCRLSAGGDQVADTPAEAEPSFYCQLGRDTCPAEGLDPVRNFMNYSFDSCMDQFTVGQVARMDLAYEHYRWRP